jgi:hypothetical protein
VRPTADFRQDISVAYTLELYAKRDAPQTRFVLGGAGFSLRGFILARTKTHRLKPALLGPPEHSEFPLSECEGTVQTSCEKSA